MHGMGLAPPARVRHVLCVLAALLVAGCTSESHGSLEHLEVLDGVSNAPLADGGALPLIAGNQGGHHVMLALRGWGIPDGAAQTSIHAAVDATPVSLVNSTVYLHGDDDGSVLSDQIRVILCPSDHPVDGQDVELQIALSRGGAAPVSTTLLVHPRCPEDTTADPSCAVSCGQP
jgi:hypothetical protein